MTVTFASGFESQSVLAEGGWGGLIGTASINTNGSFVRTGAASLRCNPASGANGTATSPSGAANYLHFALYVASLPTLDRVIAGSINTTVMNIRLTSAGALAVYNNTTLVGTSSAKFASPGWHWVGLRQVAGTSVTFLQIDEASEVTGTVATVTFPLAALGCPGTEASAIDIYFDDIVGDDTGFLAASKVDTALPISDNTITGVTDNNGVTTNIWQCVANVPPAGVASANEAANPKKGMHFPASTTCNYIANLETYTTLGVGASDTILAVQGIVRAGEDVSTGSKNIQNVAALTNPTVAGGSVLLDGGAHGAETGFWGTTLGTMTASPSVTLGTSPTIRTSRISESRLACVDFMGMLVVWTPATVSGLSAQVRTVNQAVNRSAVF